MKRGKVADGFVKIGDEVFYFPLNIADVDNYSSISKKTKVVKIEKWKNTCWIITEDNQSISGKQVFTNKNSVQFNEEKKEMVGFHLAILMSKKEIAVQKLNDVNTLILKLSKVIDDSER